MIRSPVLKIEINPDCLFFFFRIPLRYDMKYNKKKNKGEFIQVVSKAVSYSEEQHYTISISSNDLLKGK